MFKNKVQVYFDTDEGMGILKKAKLVLMVNNIKLQDSKEIDLKSLVLAYALYPNRLFSMTRGLVLKNAKLDVDFCQADSSLCEGHKSILREDMPVIEGENLQIILKNLRSGKIDWENPPENPKDTWYTPIDDLGGSLLQVSKNQIDKLGLKKIFKYHEKSSNGDMKISFKQIYIDAGILKPTQSEINFEKAFGMAKDYLEGGFDELVTYDPDNVILISREGYIIDGHHRWASVGLINTYDSESFIESSGEPDKPTLLDLVSKAKTKEISRWLAENKGRGSKIKLPVIWVDLPLKDLLLCLNACTDSLGIERKTFKS